MKVSNAWPHEIVKWIHDDLTNEIDEPIIVSPGLAFTHNDPRHPNHCYAIAQIEGTIIGNKHPYAFSGAIKQIVFVSLEDGIDPDKGLIDYILTETMKLFANEFATYAKGTNLEKCLQYGMSLKGDGKFYDMVINDYHIRGKNVNPN